MQEIDYQGFIEEYFTVVDKETGTSIPFKLNKKQQQYLKSISKEDRVRDALLKKRQTGLTTLLVAVLVVDFLIVSHSSSVIIGPTSNMNRKLKEMTIGFIEDFSRSENTKNNKLFIVVKDGGIENRLQNSLIKFSDKVGPGCSLSSVLIDEAAFFKESNGISIFEKFVSLFQSVPQSGGKIFLTSTENQHINSVFQDIYDKEHEHIKYFTSREF